MIPRYNVNEAISAPEVRVIDETDTNIGIMPTAQAIATAREREMDLVEINPKAEPPVAQFILFSHFKYQKEKEARKQKANSSVSEIKGIRLSIRIGEHDMNIRLEQAKKFLERGDKVKGEIILRGRELRNTGMAFEVLGKFYKDLNAMVPVRYEQEITRQGNKITSILIKK